MPRDFHVVGCLEPGLRAQDEPPVIPEPETNDNKALHHRASTAYQPFPATILSILMSVLFVWMDSIQQRMSHALDRRFACPAATIEAFWKGLHHPFPSSRL